MRSMPKLADLIEQSGLSYQEIADRSKGSLTKGNIGQWANPQRPLKEFPTPAKLSALAEVLGISRKTVVLAAAESVGMRILGSASDLLLFDLLPDSAAHDLTRRQQEAIAFLVRSFIDPAWMDEDETLVALRPVANRARRKAASAADQLAAQERAEQSDK